MDEEVKMLNKRADIALSDKELMNMVHGKANLLLYPNLHEYKSIDDVLGDYGACFILFAAKPNYGHWTLIFRQQPGLIEFFNSYGGLPDDSLDYISMEYRKVSNQFHTYLSALMKKSPYELSYNEFQFQSKAKDIKTCGRWCGTRLLQRYKTIYEFKDYIDEECEKLDLDPDQLVTLLSLNVA
jgi:hypothetical protein